MFNCIQLRPRNSAHLIMKLLDGSSPETHTGHIHSSQHFILGFHETRSPCFFCVCLKILNILGLCRTAHFLYSNFCVMGCAPECLFGSKSQTKSGFTSCNMYSQRTGPLEWARKPKISMLILTKWVLIRRNWNQALGSSWELETRISRIRKWCLSLILWSKQHRTKGNGFELKET